MCSSPHTTGASRPRTKPPSAAIRSGSTQAADVAARRARRLTWGTEGWSERLLARRRWVAGLYGDRGSAGYRPAREARAVLNDASGIAALRARELIERPDKVRFASGGWPAYCALGGPYNKGRSYRGECMASPRRCRAQGWVLRRKEFLGATQWGSSRVPAPSLTRCSTR